MWHTGFRRDSALRRSPRAPQTPAAAPADPRGGALRHTRKHTHERFTNAVTSSQRYGTFTYISLYGLLLHAHSLAIAHTHTQTHTHTHTHTHTPKHTHTHAHPAPRGASPLPRRLVRDHRPAAAVLGARGLPPALLAADSGAFPALLFFSSCSATSTDPLLFFSSLLYAFSLLS